MCNGKRLLVALILLLAWARGLDAATLYAKTAGGNCTAAGTWLNVSAAGADNSGPPTAADDVIFELLSGNVTIDTGCVARSVNTTSGTGSYAGAITHTAGVTWTIGDGTAGAGNVAFKLNAGMTYNINTTATVLFASTSATQQTVDYGTPNKPVGPQTFNGVAGSWILASDITFNGSILTLTNGTLNTNGKAISGARFTSGAGTKVLTLGASTAAFNQAAGTCWGLTSANTTLTANTATITCNGNAATFNGGPFTYNAVNLTGTGTAIVSTLTTITTLTRSGGNMTWQAAIAAGTVNYTGEGAARTFTLQISTTSTITTLFNVNGSSGNLMSIVSSTGGTAATLSKASGIVTCDYCSIKDSTATGGATFNATHSTDVSGNTGWNFLASGSPNLLLLGVGD